jgi:hypothetical protein
MYEPKIITVKGKSGEERTGGFFRTAIEVMRYCSGVVYYPIVYLFDDSAIGIDIGRCDSFEEAEKIISDFKKQYGVK